MQNTTTEGRINVLEKSNAMLRTVIDADIISIDKIDEEISKLMCKKMELNDGIITMTETISLNLEEIDLLRDQMKYPKLVMLRLSSTVDLAISKTYRIPLIKFNDDPTFQIGNLYVTGHHIMVYDEYEYNEEIILSNETLNSIFPR